MEYLVLLDGSVGAEQALKLTKEQVHQTGGTLLLLHVVDPSMPLPALTNAASWSVLSDPFDEVTAISLEARRAAEYLRKRAEGLRNEGLEVAWHVRQGGWQRRLLPSPRRAALTLL